MSCSLLASHQAQLAARRGWGAYPPLPAGGASRRCNAAWTATPSASPPDGVVDAVLGLLRRPRTASSAEWQRGLPRGHRVPARPAPGGCWPRGGPTHRRCVGHPPLAEGWGVAPCRHTVRFSLLPARGHLSLAGRGRGDRWRASLQLPARQGASRREMSTLGQEKRRVDLEASRARMREAFDGQVASPSITCCP